MTFRIITEETPFLSLSELVTLKRLQQSVGPTGFKITKPYYKFAGKTFDDAYKNMKIEAAKVIKDKTVSGEQPLGLTYSAISYEYSSVRYGGSKNSISAYPFGLNIQAATTVTLPQWVGLNAATAEDKAKWNDFLY